MKMDSKEKEMLLDFMKSHKLMTLATFDNKPWVATVFYVADENLNLYFLTSPKTEHGQHIAKNGMVACNIINSHQQVISQKMGLQIEGTAEKVSVFESIKKTLQMWHNTNPGKEDKLSFDNIKNKVIGARVYKVTPSRMKFFNEKLYLKEESKVFEL
jgi:uncharacterized protein YhbP (UPF0306 family)